MNDSRYPSRTNWIGRLARQTIRIFAVAAVVGTSSLASTSAITISHGISKFGDLKYPVDFQHLDYVNPDAPKGGEISIYGLGSFDSMNPYTRKGRSGRLSSSMYESLLVGTADEVSSSYGLLAESLEYPEDRSWVIFNMRPEARFSDGTPVTSADVNFSYEMLRDDGLLSFKAELAKAVASVEVLGPHRIKFVFNTDSSTRDFPSMVGGLPIFSKAWFDTSGSRLDESRMDPGIGSGAYVLDSVDPGRRIVYRRNPDYWGNDLPITAGHNNFDTIRIEYFADSTAAFEGFKAGVYTFRSEHYSKLWATSYDFPAVEDGTVIKGEFADGDVATGQSFVFNLRRKKFDDPRVREAIAHMFNFEWSNSTLFYDLYARIQSFWDNSALAATGLPVGDELALLESLRHLLPASVFDEPAVLPPESGSSSRQLDRANLRKASALLDEAGWPVGEDGIRRNAAGETLRIEFLEDSPSFDRILNPFVDNLQKLGVDAVYTRIDQAQYVDRIRNHDFDVITHIFGLSLEPSASGLRQKFGSEHVDGVFNLAGVESKAVDSLIDTLQDVKTRDEMITTVKALDRVLRAYRFWIPQWYKNVYTVAYFDIYEHPEAIPPYSLGYLSFWWHNAEKEESLRDSGYLK